MGEPALMRVERHGSIAIVRYDHPPRNFLTLRALHELRRCWASLERDPAIRVIVVAGARDGHFMLHTEVAQIGALLGSVPALPRPLLHLVSLGVRGAAWLLGRWRWLADRVLVASSEQALVRNALLETTMLCAAVERSSKITIAALNGSCIGGGLELALCFDYRIALDDPEVRIGCPEVLIGLLPGFGGSQRLARLLGTARALDFLIRGELLTAREAAAAGLVTWSVGREQLWPTVDALAARLARRPPLAIAAIKRAVRRGGARSLGRGLGLELREVARLAGTHDAQVGVGDYARELERQLALPIAEQLPLDELAGRLSRAPLTRFEGR